MPARRRRSSRSRRRRPLLTGVKRQTITDQVQLPRLYLAWLTPRALRARRRGARPGVVGADAAARTRASTSASSTTRRSAQDVSAFQQSGALGSSFLIVATARPGHTVGRDAEGDRRGDRPAAARAAGRARDAARAQPDRGVVLPPHGARRRLRRQGRPAERLLRRRRRPRLLRRGPGALHVAARRRRAGGGRRAGCRADRRVELVVEPEAKR